MSEQDNNQVLCLFGRQFFLKSDLSITDYSMFYVGQEGATLRNFMMTWNRCSFCSFDPITMTGRTESPSVNRTLMKRYYAIERAKDANVVGILVGTLGVADYLSIIQQLKETIRRAGKKSYMFAMGKLNVAKLANFMEIDIFVLIACPENSLLDSSEFYRPIVTPFEMEIACNKNREWSEEYVTDFRHLLPGLIGFYLHKKSLNHHFKGLYKYYFGEKRRRSQILLLLKGVKCNIFGRAVTGLMLTLNLYFNHPLQEKKSNGGFNVHS